LILAGKPWMPTSVGMTLLIVVDADLRRHDAIAWSESMNRLI
jgi:hypothetical protein